MEIKLETDTTIEHVLDLVLLDEQEEDSDKLNYRCLNASGPLTTEIRGNIGAIDADDEEGFTVQFEDGSDFTNISKINVTEDGEFALYFDVEDIPSPQTKDSTIQRAYERNSNRNQSDVGSKLDVDIDNIE